MPFCSNICAVNRAGDTWSFRDPLAQPLIENCHKYARDWALLNGRKSTMTKLKLLSHLGVMVLLISAGTAEATCVASGKVSRLRTGADVGNFVDIQTLGNLPTFATFFVVGSDRFYSMLAAAQGGNSFVTVTGDAASCPSSGQFRSGGN